MDGGELGLNRDGVGAARTSRRRRSRGWKAGWRRGLGQWVRGGAVSAVRWLSRRGRRWGGRCELELELEPSMVARRRAARKGRGELGWGSGVRRLKEGSEAHRSPLKGAAGGGSIRGSAVSTVRRRPRGARRPGQGGHPTGGTHLS